MIVVILVPIEGLAKDKHTIESFLANSGSALGHQQRKNLKQKIVSAMKMEDQLFIPILEPQVQ